LRAISVVAALLAVCTACGGRSQTRNPTVLRVVMTDDWAHTRPFLDAVRDFERDRPGVRVSVEALSIRQVADAVRAGIGAHAPPDVAQYHAFAAAAQGLAAPLDDLWGTTLDASEFLPGAIEDVTWAGHRYGVPLDTNTLVLVYNAGHFADRGLAPPSEWRTFADLKAAAQRLTQPAQGRRALALPVTTWQIYGWIRANGGEILSVDEQGRVAVTLDAPAVVEALSFLGDLVRSGDAFLAGSARSSDDTGALFLSGSASILPTGSWALVSATRNAPAATFRAAMLPQGLSGHSTGSVMGGSSLFVPLGARHPALARAFMQHLISDRYALALAKQEGRLPVRTRLYQDAYFRAPELQPFIDQLKVAHPYLLQAFPDLQRFFSDAITRTLHDGLDARLALEQAQRGAQAALEQAPQGAQAVLETAVTRRP
jgi:ABC-type glycerol-3-phosphate transport system substrate-binding protein